MNTPADQREPGLPAYLPELKLPPESILNYNQSVTGAKGIITAPTGLESTSVVFVHGLDLYCTSVTPSKGFDLLKDDFDYYVITSVLMGLVIASYATRKLSQNKALKQAWRWLSLAIIINANRLNVELKILCYTPYLLFIFYVYGKHFRVSTMARRKINEYFQEINDMAYALIIISII